ncbi:unnamed protein product, partial [marine sediment metagenome]
KQPSIFKRVVFPQPEGPKTIVNSPSSTVKSIPRKAGTSIFSTHDPQIMKYAKRLINLKDGMISTDERRGRGV